jgi:hypothetical protein
MTINDKHKSMVEKLLSIPVIVNGQNIILVCKIKQKLLAECIMCEYSEVEE